MGKIYSNVLVISDTQAPYHHEDTIQFLREVIDSSQKSFDLIIHIGDEIDAHALSFHTKNPNLHSAMDELHMARFFCQELQALFPNMILLESNHGSRLYRKAVDAGIPEEMLKNYNDVLKVGKGWKWVESLTIDTPRGKVYFDHGQKETALRVRNRYGISTVQGHRHQESYIDTRKTPFGNLFAMQVGCLIDTKSRAFAYNKTDLNPPMLSLGTIIEGVPHLIQLNEVRPGKWDGKLNLSVAVGIERPSQVLATKRRSRASERK